MTDARKIRRILIVDDDPLDGTLAESSIRAASHSAEILVVQDSKEASERFAEFDPDLTLIDIHMPDLDGFGVLQEIHGFARDKNRRIVMLSGSTRVVDRMRAYELGADDYKVKPSSLAEYWTMADTL